MVTSSAPAPESGAAARPDSSRPLLVPPGPLPLAAAEADAGTMPGTFLAQAERYDTRIVLTFKTASGSWPAVTWRELRDSAVAFGAALVAAGVEAGERLAILSENRLEWLIADLGTQLAGVIVVPIYASSTSETIRQVLQSSEPAVVVCSTPAQAAKLEAVRAECPSVRVRVLLEGALEGYTPFAELGAGVTGDTLAALAERARAVRPSDPFTIIYTSGTTGVPKGVILTHDNVVQDARALIDLAKPRADDSAISFLPWAHVYERVQGIVVAITTGFQMAIPRDLNHIAEDLRRVRPTLMNGVPRMYEKIQEAIEARVNATPGWRGALARRAFPDCVERARLRRAGRPVPMALEMRCRLWDRLVIQRTVEGLGGRLRLLSSGGGPINIATLEFFDALGIIIIEGYGLTETSGGVFTNVPEDPHFGTVGRIVTGHEVRFAADGEIEVRGPAIMRGYFRDPQSTADVLKDGWFSTGDIGEIDADGFLRITDRKKDLIVTAGGKNIAPQPIEGAIMQNPLVQRACVIGDRRKYLIALLIPNFDALRDWARGQGVTAGTNADLVHDPQVTALYTGIAEKASAGLAKYETIKKIALLDRDFEEERGELTPTLKVRRKVVMETFAGVIEGLYA